jgi:hypothetical protein
MQHDDQDDLSFERLLREFEAGCAAYHSDSAQGGEALVVGRRGSKFLYRRIHGDTAGTRNDSARSDDRNTTGDEDRRDWRFGLN